MADSEETKCEDAAGTTETADGPRFPVVVGIGASAGGLDPLRKLLGAIPENNELTFVVIQHLDPTHESALTELLSRETAMAVEEVSRDVEVEPNHVYVIPPNKYLSIHDCVLKLSDPAQQRGARRAIDYFFASLARDRCEHAIGIILSGTGTDGTAGIREIKEAGGMIIAQSPGEAGQDGMPRSAINSGYVDLVLPVGKMSERLIQYVRHSYLHGPLMAQAAQQEGQDQLGTLVEILRQRTEFDFRRYRRNTLSRRVQRRMGLQQFENLNDYLHLLRDNQKEAKALARDLLIGVTHFFRDPKAWETLEENVLTPLFAQNDGTESVRVWVAGCATGEEAYSIAMLLHEHADRNGTKCKFQIFATDIAADALETVRAGVYPETISDSVSETRLRRYFVKEGDSYRVRMEVRESVVFAPQNVLSHPPFSKLDLITCRNLLIYLETEAQKRLLSVFQFALKQGGHLFLGASEAIGDRSGYFTPVSKKWRIYKRKQITSPPLIDFSDGLLSDTSRLPRKDPRGRDQQATTLSERIHNQLLSESESAIAVVNDDNRVLFLQGPIEDYLQFHRGEITPELPDLMLLGREGLRAKIRNVLHQVQQSDSVVRADARVKRDGHYFSCRVTARRLKGGPVGDDENYLVTFEPISDKPVAAVPGDSATSGDVTVRELELELSTTREQLNSTIEELETANEELKASNEEAMAMNEELQSNNEELETSKEELQSLNEELTTLNNQLEQKVEQLQRTTNDLSNLMSSIQIGVVFLDAHLRIRMFTPAAAEQFHVISGDVGRRLTDITMRFSDEDLVTDAEAVLETLQPREAQVRSEAGRWYVRRIVPYRSDDNRIEGVVLTFADVSRLEKIAQKLRQRERQQGALAELGHYALRQDDLQPVFERAVELVSDALETDYTKVLELLPGGQRLLMRAGVGWQDGLVGTATVGIGKDSQAGHTLRSETPVIVEQLSSETRFNDPDLLTQHGVVSGVSVIIRGESGLPYGVLATHTKEKRAFTGEDVNYLDSIANILGEVVERTRVQTSLMESEQRFRMLADNMAQLAWTCDVLGQCTWYNNRWYEYTGASFEEVQGDGWKKFHHPDHLPHVTAGLEECAQQGTRWEDTFPLLGQDGEYRWFLSRAIPIRDEEGAIVCWFGTNTDITARREAEESLRESDELVRTIAENSTQGLAMMDERGYCTYANKAWLEMTGFAAEEICSKPLHDLVHHHYPDGRPYPIEECPVDRALPENFDIRAHEDVFFRKDGSTFPVMCAASPIFQDGKPVSTVIEIRDVTEAKRAEQALRDADRRKDEFLATLSHELRNPLAPIRSGLEVLKRAGGDTQTVDEVSETLERQLQQLIRLVDDLLDATRITRGKLQLRKSSVLLAEIVETSVDGSRVFVEEAGQELTVEMPEEPIRLDADPDRLIQVLCNLLHNAAKYTPRGGHINLQVRREGGTAVVSVKDDGIGIPDDKRQHIFEMFGQLSPSGQAGQSGLGIGLTLVKSLVDLHGGRIEVNSDGVNRGAEFVVRLPIQEGPETDKAQAQPPGSREEVVPARKQRVLIVDDNESALEMLAMLVRTFPADVQTATDGLQAVEVAAEFRPDVILMDIGMPRMNGYEAAQKIREQPWGAEMVLVALTGWGQDGDKRDALKAGFNQHLTKPTNVTKLQALLAAVQRGKPASRSE